MTYFLYTENLFIYLSHVKRLGLVRKIFMVDIFVRLFFVGRQNVSLHFGSNRYFECMSIVVFCETETNSTIMAINEFVQTHSRSGQPERDS